jgi:hypothetical protein
VAGEALVNTGFHYEEMTGRNRGFITEAEQQRLRETPVFVCGVGGMGGAAVQTLVRTGVGRIAIADFDRFEVSNFNRQVFATLASAGQEKTDAVAHALRDINPELDLRVYGREWTAELDAILATHRVVINGMDDIAAGIHLYRRARERGATVIDAYSAPLPSVFVTRPADRRPEERLGYPTRDTAWDRLTAEHITACKLAEASYVMVHSSSARQFDLGVAAEMFAGRRPRASFAPMVILTGTLMASEAVKVALGRPGVADGRGRFFNPWTLAIERPRPRLVAAILRPWVRRRLEALTGDG